MRLFWCLKLRQRKRNQCQKVFKITGLTVVNNCSSLFILNALFLQLYI